jgi:hypothetical protein
MVPGMSATILYGDRPVLAGSARVDGERLWLSPDDLLAATGWSREPEGLCRGDACVPLPEGAVDAEGLIDVTVLAERLRQPVVHDADRAVWAFGSSAGRRGEDLLTLQAPDFTLRDLDGVEHSLSDYRGKKVFLHSYGTY